MKFPNSKPDVLRQQLQDAGARLAQADAERQAALEQIGEAMRAGRGVLNIQEMSDLAGVSRVTAYRLIEKT